MNRFARLALRAPLVLSKHLWIWPVLGAVLFIIVSLSARTLIEGTMKAELVTRLQSMLNSDVAVLRVWLSEREADTHSFVSAPGVQEGVHQLALLSKDSATPAQNFVTSSAAAQVRDFLEPFMAAQRYEDYLVISPDGRILAAGNPANVGLYAPSNYDAFLRRSLAGQTTVSRPFLCETLVGSGRLVPAMFAAAPAFQYETNVVAVLALRMRPEGEFSRILGAARVGESGEAFAFGRDGVMLTASRFEDDLRALRLIPNSAGASSILNVRLVDPGFDLTENPLTSHPPPEELPLTRMAAAATTEWGGYDVEGYRSYRGVKVVGAWAWLPEYQIGVATEIGSDEAFQTLYMLRRVFFTLFLLLLLSGVAIFIFSMLVERLQASVRRTALAARRLGQYVLVQEIGRGSSGMVYRARHTFLRRPVAVKLLSPELTNELTAASFEHEVQMTSQLTHPNTVAIYDYGQTPEGLFYYAMEYLSGITLDRLVRQFGPQPEGRVIHILRQVCGSLAEAHRIGLIHRDIKPANIVLTRRGGVCDTVKVLDFGLVKAVNLGPKGLAPNAIVGTPHFMSPESVRAPETVDHRTDIYSLGAVGYWLLTGKTLFETENVDQLMQQQAGEAPPYASDRGARVSPDLEALLMRCLAKDPAARPAKAEDLDSTLAGCSSAGSWLPFEAESWWRNHMGGEESVPAATLPEKTIVIQPRR